MAIWKDIVAKDSPAAEPVDPTPAPVVRPRPEAVGKWSVKITGSPGSPSARHGYVTAPSCSSRSHVTPPMLGMA